MRALQKLYDKGVSIKRPRAVTVREAAICVCVCVCVCVCLRVLMRRKERRQ